ncbi:MAG: bifunctional oligoribonuclease/PAP phosphatase NrnA [Moorella humiferrea]|uniref:Bifunctional oligoribonuclease and PAP phosphatase NrnA n=1 Tax=Neomoorella humiferrea TaxID=676965 RepID=A0A2T0ANE1_9FIRM|nr:bifunctional oligoribonuclease/PAP phosphatase NrnA [Moorella humiferrea]MBE3571642.1 bifunctional oligoribonuclease/PAP phosphatase NrnA [Moorella humiferrea]PRR70477.1 Bifunctional oligoribonuclease and PAP phosphatase NrnA [Moorella humiferrea]
MTEIETIAAVLATANDVAVVSHVIPDGDCLGSTLALALALRQRGAKVTAINADPVPETFRFLPGWETIVSPEKVDEIPSLLVMVDSTDMERGGEVFSGWREKAEMIINIDHHVSNTRFGHLNLVDGGAAATAELIYAVLKKIPVAISPAIATCLYTALATDTGSFQYENCTAATMRLAADLMELGADLPLIREFLWERKPLAAIRLLAEVLPTLTLGYGGRVAWMKVSTAALKASGALPEHAEGLVNYPRCIAGVEVGLLFRELPDGQVKVSLRSKKTVDVNTVAARFGGGGHRRAAGCTVKGDLETVTAMVVAAAGEAL